MESVDELREKGNECVKNENFHEAILHYTHAIKMEPKNYTLYSNRSFAFLKIQQYGLAMEDAQATIKLKPDWAKGYYRKGEIELATYQYQNAIQSYAISLQLQPDNIFIIQCLQKARIMYYKELKAANQIPWLGAGVGLVIGVAIVISDYFLTKDPTLTNPVLMVLMVIVLSTMGYGVAKTYLFLSKTQRDGLVQATGVTPADGKKDQNTNNNSNNSKQESTTAEKITPRYTKAQARHRFKKGKL